MRRLRLLIALAVAVVAVVIIVGEQMAGVSSNAMVNAQVLILRAPIDGEVNLAVRTLGTRIRAGEPLATLTDPRADDTRIVDLQRETRRVMIDVERHRALLAALQPMRDAFARQSGTHAEGRVRQLEARLGEAQATLEGMVARMRENDAAFRRAAELARSGSQSIAELSRTRSGFEVATQDVQGARERVAYLTIELEAARRGTFIGDSYNDLSYSEQRLRDMDQRLAELSVEVRDRANRLEALRDQVDEERVREARHREARILAPTSGILWEIMSGSGEYVRKAQDVVRVVDCTTTMVTASVRESLYNRLRVGDPVQFRLLGSNTIYDGVIARLAGSGAETIYRSLAIGPSQEQLKRFDVMVTSPALARDPETACSVGRTGKVVFSSRPLDFWRELLAEIGLR